MSDHVDTFNDFMLLFFFLAKNRPTMIYSVRLQVVSYPFQESDCRWCHTRSKSQTAGGVIPIPRVSQTAWGIIVQIHLPVCPVNVHNENVLPTRYPPPPHTHTKTTTHLHMINNKEKRKKARKKKKKKEKHITSCLNMIKLLFP